MNKSTFVSYGDSEWRSRTSQTAEVLHQLTHDKVDDEVGPMFRVRFSDGVETDAFLDELPELEKYLLGEVIFDITRCIGLYCNKDEFDSRDLYACIFEWANEFQKMYPATGFDYLLTVEEFARKKLEDLLI